MEATLDRTTEEAAQPEAAPARCPPIAEMSLEGMLAFRINLDERRSRMVRGYRSPREGHMFVHLELNRFEEEDSLIPHNAQPVEVNEGWALRFLWNPAKTRLLPDIQSLPAKASGVYYRIEDNGGTPFVCYVRESEVSVFCVPKNGHFWDEDWTSEIEHDRLFYTEEVGTWGSLHTWVGKDPNCGRHGNSVLVHTASDSGVYHYVFIGWNIYSFSTTSPVCEYHSSMGNSSVPYPVGVTEARQLLMMLDRVQISCDELVTRTEEHTGARKRKQGPMPRDATGQVDWAHAYQFYYPVKAVLSESSLADVVDVHERV